MYVIETTEDFAAWFDALPRKVAFRITARIDRVKDGNFGDTKRLDESLSELRFFFGSGYRVYYTIRGGAIVLLLAGGDKSSQTKDIKKAKALLAAME
ncbi:MAG: hypothetical protein BWK73_48350 [Thiothrix lacustris]|uniref:Addiction module antitoxin RelB n=1 Tax=Thiothrix lacustris TaxID=525917 RepID=A0A1Y1Q9D6_9GAMM|nr:MAG: hypothetical protein BWK73_48350 [Thiothrix lacustris]